MNRTERRRLSKLRQRRELRSPWRWWRQGPRGVVVSQAEITDAMRKAFAECKSGGIVEVRL